MPDITTSAHTQKAPPDSRTIALADLLASFRRYRLLIVWITAACICAGCLAAWLLPKKYEATALLAPVTDQGGSKGLSALTSSLGQIGGLASLAGVSLPEGNGQAAESVATLQSDALTERYVSENNLLPVLFASRWNPQLRTWNTTDPERVPSGWKANRLFAKKIRVVTENPKTGLVTITITWRDPRLAAQWANGLVKLTNDYLRAKAIAESERDIAYLNATVANTNVVELRSAIYALIESQIRKEMLAKGSDEHALKVIDPASIPELPSSPGFIVWCLVGAGAGLIVSGVLAVALSSIRT